LEHIPQPGERRRGPLYQVFNGLGMAALLVPQGNYQPYFQRAKTMCEAIQKTSRPYQTIAHHAIALLALGDEDAHKILKKLEKFKAAIGWLWMIKRDIELLQRLFKARNEPQIVQMIATALGILDVWIQQL